MATKLTQDQYRYLTSRLAVVQREKNSAIPYKKREPAHVRAAHHVIKKFNDEQQKERQSRVSKLDRAVAAVREVILFGDATKALTAVKRLESTKF